MAEARLLAEDQEWERVAWLASTILSAWCKRPPSPRRLLAWRWRGRDVAATASKCFSPGESGWDEFVKQFPGFDPGTVSPRQRAKEKGNGAR